MPQMGWIPEDGDRVVLANKDAASIIELEDIDGIAVAQRDGVWSVDVELDGGGTRAEVLVEYNNGHWEEVEE